MNHSFATYQFTESLLLRIVRLYLGEVYSGLTRIRPCAVQNTSWSRLSTALLIVEKERNFAVSLAISDCLLQYLTAPSPLKTSWEFSSSSRISVAVAWYTGM